MRIELDKPLSRKTLRQSMKMLPNNVKRIKVICGSGIFDVDRIVSKNDTLFLCTDSQQTIDFLEKNKNADVITTDEWYTEWKEYYDKHGLPIDYIH